MIMILIMMKMMITTSMIMSSIYIGEKRKNRWRKEVKGNYENNKQLE